MAQWDVYENPSARARAEVPYLIDIQSGLLSQLATRFVVPLVPRGATSAAGLPKRLIPSFVVRGQPFRLVPHEAGVVGAGLLRKPVATLRHESHRIVDALDSVVSGV